MRRKDDEKEQRIRKSVITLTLKEGFNGTSIAKIAKMAGVSPATVYIYYENKEDMLQDIYLRYSEEVFDYLLSGIRCDMDPAQLIETLIRRYYSYMTHHPEAFCFVEQFSACPSMASKCSCERGMQSIFRWIEKKKAVRFTADTAMRASAPSCSIRSRRSQLIPEAVSARRNACWKS